MQPQSYSWWQMLARMVTHALLVGGAAGLLSAAYYQLRGRLERTPRTIALASLAVLALGIVLYALTRQWTEPS